MTIFQETRLVPHAQSEWPDTMMPPGTASAKPLVQRVLERFGRPWMVVGIALTSASCSWLIATLTQCLGGNALPPTVLWLSFVSPVVITVPISWLVLGMLQRLREKSEELELARGELMRSEKMAALGSLVVGVAHELGTPLGNSVTIASALQERTHSLHKALSEGLQRPVLDTYIADTTYGTEILMTNLQQIAHLVENFKQVALHQDQKYRRCFDLYALIQKITETLAPALDANQHTFTLNVQSDVEMDSFPEQLEQILVMLINNALLHGFAGRKGGCITVRAHQKNHCTVRISVRDNGCGIPFQHQQRVFEPFFTTKLGHGGSGLGLAVVRNIVSHVLGGRVDVISRLGEGTKVFFDIPLIAPEVLTEPQFMLSGNYTGMQRAGMSAF